MQEYFCVKCEHKDSCSYPAEINEVITMVCDNGLDEMIELTCKEFKKPIIKEGEYHGM